MSPSQATAEVFVTALKSLSKKERAAVLACIAEEPGLRKDLLDLALVAKRRREPSRRLRDYLAEKQR